MLKWKKPTVIDFAWFIMNIFFISAINCTDTPVIPAGLIWIDPDDPNAKFPTTYKKGVFDWDMENKTFDKVIKYSCTGK